LARIHVVGFAGGVSCLRVRSDGCADYSAHQHTNELIPFRGHTNQHTNDSTSQHANAAANIHVNTTTAHTNTNSNSNTYTVAQALDERRMLRATILGARLKASAVH
jgi:hypothetical protein